MNNHVKNQHYVPQFLLKNFSSRERKFIWAYDKNEKYSIKNQIKERPIKKVASEEYFYDQNENNEIESYEYALQKVEEETAPIIQKILQTKNIIDLLEQERRTLSFFITLQDLRTKGQLLRTETSMETLSKQL
jgi:DNA-binding protein Fis